MEVAAYADAAPERDHGAKLAPAPAFHPVNPADPIPPVFPQSLSYA